MPRPLLGLACLVLLLGAAPAAAERLTVAYLGPDGDAAFRGALLPWAREVSASSGGAAAPQLMPDGLLGRDAGEQAGLVDRGQADVAWVRTDLHPDRFPDDGVLRLPGVVRSVGEGAATAWALQAQGLLRGYDRYKVIAHVAGPPARLVAAKAYTTMRQVRLGRWRIGVASAEAALGIESLTAVPERVPQDRIGFAQAEGVIVAALAELRELLSADAHARYKQVVDLAGGAPTFALLMDRRRYAALPEAARKALDGAGGVAFARRYGAAMAADDRAALAELTRGGKRTVVVLSDADRAEWDKASEKAQRAWAAKHPNGKALLDAALGAR